MKTQAYVGLTKRTFEQALIHLLETEYGVLGSRRVLDLLAKDVHQLVDQFYPAPERLQPGWLVFTGTKANGPKAYPGQRASDLELATLAWPVLTADDVKELTNIPETKQARRPWFQQRLVRLIEYGWHHPDGPVLLTLADLGVMLGLTGRDVSDLLSEARQTTGKPLLTKGHYFDQGMRPTHKEEIIALYEQGLDEVDIAHRSGHAQQSVGHYIRDYERVKLLLQQGISEEQIRRLTDMQPNRIKTYVKLVYKYHSDLEIKTKSSHQT
jgi:DNA-binding CsgD family transcriptional regulator